MAVCAVRAQLLLPLVAEAKDAQALLAGHERAQRLTKAVDFGIVLCVCVIALRFPRILYKEEQKAVGPPKQLCMNVAWQTAGYPLPWSVKSPRQKLPHWLSRFHKDVITQIIQYPPYVGCGLNVHQRMRMKRSRMSMSKAAAIRSRVFSVGSARPRSIRERPARAAPTEAANRT